MMQRILTTAAALIVLSSPALAHSPGGHPPIEELTELLALDEYQAGEVDRILTERFEQARAQREALKASGQRPDREALRAEWQARHAETLEQLRGVLTAEQVAKLEGYMQGRKHGHGRHHHERHGGQKEAAETT